MASTSFISNGWKLCRGISYKVGLIKTLFQLLTRFLSCHRAEPPTYALVEWLFIRILGLIYFMAFASLAVQITGLIGSHGLLPAGDYLQAIHDRFGSQSYALVPTLFWLNSGDAFLKAVCVTGAVLALVLLAGYAQRLILIALFLLYLSLVLVGQDFLAFQWDALLLEAGFLAIFLGNLPLVIWLFRWLLFRLVFLSGAVKLLSGDLTWRSLTALNYHYETQPLPTPLAWYMHQLPAGFQKLSVAVVLIVELGAPLLILAPRRLRIFAAAAIVFLQTLIGLTGNYAFFNLLTVALCIFLLDDAALRRWFPDRLAQALLTRQANHKASLVGRWIAAAVAVLIVLVGGFQIVRAFGGPVPRPVRVVMNWVAPFEIVNPYGLFAVMTTSRPEIIVEGSSDGRTWVAYEFKYKPGDVTRPPRWVAPYQPRLDWQMWFAALGSCYDNPWFVNFILRLQQGSPDVLALLGKNPFPDAPPRYIRALVYDYHFTDLATRRADGTWWWREPMGAYDCRFS
jgi:lipase maturation factor 1